MPQDYYNAPPGARKFMRASMVYELEKEAEEKRKQRNKQK